MQNFQPNRTQLKFHILLVNTCHWTAAGKRITLFPEPGDFFMETQQLRRSIRPTRLQISCSSSVTLHTLVACSEPFPSDFAQIMAVSSKVLVHI